jgi:hypothetical protein
MGWVEVEAWVKEEVALEQGGMVWVEQGRGGKGMRVQVREGLSKGS